jgi:hypothetical protein
VADQASQLPIDLSSATTTNYILQDPFGVNKTVTASLFTNGKDGKLTYTTVLGDLTTASGFGGQWSIQLDLSIAGVYIGRSSIATFNVSSNL